MQRFREGTSLYYICVILYFYDFMFLYITFLSYYIFINYIFILLNLNNIMFLYIMIILPVVIDASDPTNTIFTKFSIRRTSNRLLSDLSNTIKFIFTTISIRTQIRQIRRSTALNLITI